jgi:probable HAF family extracellular repeat protein
VNVGITGHSQLFLDSNGTVTQLPLPSFASASRATGCSATAINNNGMVLGGCDDASSDLHGVVWQNGTPTDLGLNFFPAAIYDNGVIVGGDEIYSGGTLQNLNNLIPAGSPQISYAVAINDNGQIVATSGGQTLLLTPN